MRRLPRPNEIIFDTGELWTPDKMPEALDAAFSEIEDSIGAGGGSGDFGLWAQTGRLQLTTGAGDKPAQLPASPALTLTLPVGFIWLQNGATHQIAPDDGERIIGPIPANFTGFVTLQVLADGTDWQIDTAPARAPLGSGTLAYVETDADGVTLLETDDANADVIPSVPVLAARLRATEDRLQVLEAGGDGGTGTIGPAYASKLPWQPAPGDVRDTVTVVLELMALLETELLEAIADGGRRPRETIVDQIVREMAIVRQTTVALSPNDGLRSQSANVLSTVDGIFGDGGNWPDYLETEMTLNPDGTLEA